MSIPSVTLTHLELVHMDGQDWYAFSWTGDDFTEALRRVKEWIAPECRRFDGEEKRWYVLCDMGEEMLVGIFPNFKDELEKIR